VRAAAKLVGCSWNASFSGQICIRKPDVKATIFQVVLPCRIKKTARLRSESPAAEVPLIPGLEGGYVRSSEFGQPRHPRLQIPTFKGANDDEVHRPACSPQGTRRRTGLLLCASSGTNWKRTASRNGAAFLTGVPWECADFAGTLSAIKLASPP
jgi:hypothetical protein